ncbi:MAG: ATP/GTP-binding protein [Bacillota bacterium]|nr:ATP/GTP-binding protein [Bacillota bacterium]
MLIRFSVENFKSFSDKQVLTMIGSKKLRTSKDHLMKIGDVSLLKNATIYGANASGKSNFVEAIRFAKYIVKKGIPLESKDMFCRNKESNMSRPTTFEFELYKNGNFYAYGFSIYMNELVIDSEWLYKLNPIEDDQVMLFERETGKKRIALGASVNLNKTDQMKFQTYKLDFEENNEDLFLNEMNRQKKITSDSGLVFFKDIFEWIKDDLITISPNQPITSFEHFYGNDSGNRINELIELFDTGISKVKLKAITKADLKNKLPEEVADNVLNAFKEKQEEHQDNTEVMLSLRTHDAFYNLKGSKGQDPIITTIMLEHVNAYSDFKFSEESDGTRRLFDLLDILISDKTNKVYILDELERSLHPKLTYKFIELFFDILCNRNVQLIFTTHESTIMKQELLRRDEIWFIERDKNNISKLFSLDRFNERYDRKLSKAYLAGRYGAIPVFKDYLIKECDE